MRSKAEESLREVKARRSVPASLASRQVPPRCCRQQEAFPALPQHGRGGLSCCWAAGKLWVGGGRHQKPGTIGFSERKAAGVWLPTERAEVGLRRKSWEAQVAVPHIWLGPLPAPHSVEKPQERSLGLALSWSSTHTLGNRSRISRLWDWVSGVPSMRVCHLHTVS